MLVTFAESGQAALRPGLLVGDVVAGTPFGVGGFRQVFLKEADMVRIELEGVGALENGVGHA
jgi:2-keto-4-pentenoate hydratase/2-oxohepta-3-ene-1,7-dioic acid hydratase in catechol pathway